MKAPSTLEGVGMKSGRVLFFCLISFYSLFGDIAQAAKKQVVFIRYQIEVSHFNTVIHGFKETMNTLGYVEGVDVEYVDILTRSADQASIADVLEAVEKWQDSADMFITCGWVSMFARKELAKTDVPQLFVPVLESVAYKVLPSVSEAPDTNLSGIYLMYPPEKILRLTRLLLPELKRYAYVYDSRIPADMVFKTAYENVSEAERQGISIHYVDVAKGVRFALDILREEKIEAFGGIVGSFKNRQALAGSNLPIITSFAIDIEKEDLGKSVRDSHIVAGLFNPFRYCGEQAAEMTADIFKGKTTIQKTVPRPAMQMAFINLEAARKFNIKTPFSALEAVDLVIK